MLPVNRDPAGKIPKHATDDNLLPNGQVGVVTPAMVNAAGHPGSPAANAYWNPPPPAPPPQPGIINKMTTRADELMKQKFVPTDTTAMKQAYENTLNTFDAQAAAAQAQAANDPARQNMLLLAQGQGPAADAARAQLQAGIDKSNAQAMSMAASARGGAGARALGARSAMQQAAVNNQAGANQAAGLRAQMSMQGMEGLAGLRGQDMDMNRALILGRGQIGGQYGSDLGRAAMTDTTAGSQFTINKYGTGLDALGRAGQLIIQNRNVGNEERKTDIDEAKFLAGRSDKEKGEWANMGSAAGDFISKL